MRSSFALALAVSAPLAAAQKVCFDRTDHVTGSDPTWIAIGDVDEDGVLDLVVAHSGSETLGVLLGLGNGDFGPVASFPSGGSPRSVTLGDVTGDGHLDAVVANEVAGRVTVHAGDGAGAFAPTSVVSVGSGPRVAALADFDLDGALDLAVAHHSAAELRVLFGDGSGGFGEPFIVRAPGGIPHLAVLDTDLDGDPDIVCAQDQLITFAPFVVENLGDRTFAHVPGSSASGDPIWIAFADYDGDGFKDLVAPADDSLGALIEVNRNDGQNHFNQTIAFLGYASVVETGDFDGDGTPDVVYDESFGSSVTVVPDLGDFALPINQTPTGLTFAKHLAVADLNGDGYDDFVAAFTEPDTISVMQSRGPGFAGAFLSACPDFASVADGGRQTIRLTGPSQPLGLYLLMTTTAGTSPGLQLAPTTITLPLNSSQLLLFTATNPGLLVPGSLGFLDAQGEAELELVLPAGLDPSLAGVTLHNAYAVFDVATLTAKFASNAAPLQLVP